MPPTSKSIRCLRAAVMALIALNVLAVIIETVPSIGRPHTRAFYVFEVFSVVVFSLEYAIRLIFCTRDERYAHPVWSRLRWMVSFMAIVDLLAILPFYLPMLIPFDLRIIRGLRMFRIFRILKIGRYSRALELFARVLKSKKEELALTLFAVLMLLVIVSALMYYAEREAQPEAFSSIPAAMWWGVATLTTVGYGDVFPVTVAGKFLGAIVAMLGIGLFALPAGILASGFSEAVAKGQACPHCGKELTL